MSETDISYSELIKRMVTPDGELHLSKNQTTLLFGIIKSLEISIERRDKLLNTITSGISTKAPEETDG